MYIIYTHISELFILILFPFFFLIESHLTEEQYSFCLFLSNSVLGFIPLSRIILNNRVHGGALGIDYHHVIHIYNMYLAYIVVVVQSLSYVRLFVTHGLQHTRLPCPSLSPQTHVHQVIDAIQPSHFLSSPPPPALNLSQHQSFPVSWLFALGGQIIGASASATVLPKNIQD